MSRISHTGAGSNKVELEFLFSNKEGSASEHSISSMVSSISVSQDENFRVSKHAENSFKVMEKYLHEQQLTDVILIAGKIPLSLNNVCLSAMSHLILN